MTDLFNFNKEDVLSGATAEQAVLKTKGFFGDSLHELINAVERNNVRTLSYIDKFDAHCFTADHIQHYTLFLPLDKISHTYRPFNSVDELFDFLMPNFNKDSVYDQTGNKIEVDTNKKAVYLLGKKIILKKKENGQINALFIQHIKFNSDNSNVYLNNVSLDYIFHIYDIEKDDKWVTFGILEE